MLPANPLESKVNTRSISPDDASATKTTLDATVLPLTTSASPVSESTSVPLIVYVSPTVRPVYITVSVITSVFSSVPT